MYWHFSVYKKTDFFNFSFKGTRIVQAKTNALGFCVTVRGRPSWELWAAPLSAHAYLAACSLSTCELVSTCAVDVAKNSVLFVWSRKKVPLGRVAGTTKRAPWHQCKLRSLERIINVNNPQMFSFRPQSRKPSPLHYLMRALEAFWDWKFVLSLIDWR